MTFAVLLTITAFSCSMPLFSKVQPNKGSASFLKPSKLTGVLQMEGECGLGYYQIHLQGLFEYSNVVVQSQSDESGRFNLIAPPGKYLMNISKGDCGSKQSLELESNTEHMVSVPIREVKSHEKYSERELKNVNRLPASILIPE